MIKMLRSILLVGILLVAMAFTASTQRETTEITPAQCNITNTAFGAGEEITYKLYYNWNFVWLSAGEVTFKVTEEAGQFHINAKGITYPSYEWFFKVRDNYDSYINKESLLPSVSIRDVKEGTYKLYDKVTFDQAKHKATSLRGDSPSDAKHKDFLIDECMHDLLSVIYYTRNLDFDHARKGQQFPVKIFLDRDVFNINVQFVERGTTRIKEVGKYKTIKANLQTISGEVFKDGAKIQLWATDDANRIPLLIESPVSVGSVKAVLKSYKGLRSPLTSKVI